MPLLTRGENGSPLKFTILGADAPQFSLQSHPISLISSGVDATQLLVAIPRIDGQVVSVGWVVADLGSRADWDPDAGYILFDRSTAAGSELAQARHELATASSTELHVGASADADTGWQDKAVTNSSQSNVSMAGLPLVAVVPGGAAATQAASMTMAVAPHLALPPASDGTSTGAAPTLRALVHPAIMSSHDASAAVGDETGDATQSTERSESVGRLEAYLPLNPVRTILSQAWTVASSAGESLGAWAGADDASRDRVGMLASVALNHAALDEAIENLIDDAEQLGGGMISWLEEIELPAGSYAATAVAAAGLGNCLQYVACPRQEGPR